MISPSFSLSPSQSKVRSVPSNWSIKTIIVKAVIVFFGVKWTLWTTWTMNTLIPKHGGYRSLKSFQIAQLVYDITIRFCNKFVGSKSRTHDQMVQAARSGVQNITEGSQASGTSK